MKRRRRGRRETGMQIVRRARVMRRGRHIMWFKRLNEFYTLFAFWDNSYRRRNRPCANAPARPAFCLYILAICRGSLIRRLQRELVLPDYLRQPNGNAETGMRSVIFKSEKRNMCYYVIRSRYKEKSDAGRINSELKNYNRCSKKLLICSSFIIFKIIFRVYSSNPGIPNHLILFTKTINLYKISI